MERHMFETCVPFHLNSLTTNFIIPHTGEISDESSNFLRRYLDESAFLEHPFENSFEKFQIFYKDSCNAMLVRVLIIAVGLTTKTTSTLLRKFRCLIYCSFVGRLFERPQYCIESVLPSLS